MNEQEQPLLKRSNVLLDGHYHVIGMVGKGGFGAVYKAEDVQRNDALVAIKEINLGGLSSQEVIEATDTFNREVRLLSGLEHPNLPRIHDHFTDPEHWYLVMDFIEGETLEEYLDSTKDKHLPVAEVLAIGMQLCTVLDYLHTRQPPIIFRDVKPANIMRTSTGHLYLIDFGIARRFTPGQARDTMPLGSPGYAPPEQYGKAQTTVQSDIYGLGATLQTLLTGKDPLELTSDYESPYAEDQEVPAELELLLVQMLDLDASKRPASTDAVKRELQRIQEANNMSKPEQPQSKRVNVGRGIYVMLIISGSMLLFGGLAAVYYNITLQYIGDEGASLISSYLGVVFPLFAIGGIVFLIGLIRLVKQMPKGSGSIASLVGVGLIVGLPVIGGVIAQSPLVMGPYPLFTYRGHSNAVYAVTWSPDGKRIASGSGSLFGVGSDDNTVQVWDAVDGGHVFTYRGHSGPVKAVAWSPDGKRIASGSSDGTVQVWDAVDGRHVFTYRGHSGPVNTVAWSPDGKRIASADGYADGYVYNQKNNDHTVQVWDAVDGRHVFTYRGHSDWVEAVAWSPDGKRIASGSDDKTVQVWDAADGGHVFTYRGHSRDVNAVAWSPDGKRIASASIDGTVQVWDATDGGHVYTYRGHSGPVAWSPDGKRIASGNGDGTVQVWDAASGTTISTYQRDYRGGSALAWSPDGKYIASGGFYPDNTVQVWNAP